MDFKEVIPIRAVRKFDVMCLHNEYLHQNKELRQQILSWATELLEEAREHWGDIHATTIDAVIKTHHKEKAHKGAIVRDKKYAEFRENFTKIQKEKLFNRLMMIFVMT